MPQRGSTLVCDEGPSGHFGLGRFLSIFVRHNNNYYFLMKLFSVGSMHLGFTQ